MEPSDVSQVARFLRGDDIVDNAGHFSACDQHRGKLSTFGSLKQ